MSILRVATIEPEGATTTLTLGASGDTVTSSADSIKANTFKDAGGNTLWTSDGSGTLSSVNSGISSKGPQLILSQTASSSSSISFTSGIDSTYDKYMFVLTDIRPDTDGTQLTFQCSTDGGSNYNTNLTTTFFRSTHDEAGTATAFSYLSGEDQAGGTSYQLLGEDGTPGIGNGADECLAGTMYLFDPSNTVQVKNFIIRSNYYQSNESTNESDVAGFFNTTSAINAIDFKMASGTFNGKITMWGVL